MNIGRRQFERYQVPNDTLYILCEDPKVKGWVTDISRGGLGFRYFPIGDFETKSKIKLILAGDKVPVYVSDLPCKTIYDIRVKENGRPTKGAGVRCYGVQYEKLDSEIEEKLADLLNSDVVLPSI